MKMTEQQEIAMFGCTKAEIHEYVQNEVLGGSTVREASFIAMSIMSDVQELLGRVGNEDTSRQYLNRAKFILAQYVR